MTLAAVTLAGVTLEVVTLEVVTLVVVTLAAMTLAAVISSCEKNSDPLLGSRTYVRTFGSNSTPFFQLYILSSVSSNYTVLFSIMFSVAVLLSNFYSLLISVPYRDDFIQGIYNRYQSLIFKFFLHSVPPEYWPLYYCTSSARLHLYYIYVRCKARLRLSVPNRSRVWNLWWYLLILSTSIHTDNRQKLEPLGTLGTFQRNPTRYSKVFFIYTKALGLERARRASDIWGLLIYLSIQIYIHDIHHRRRFYYRWVRINLSTRQQAQA